MASIVGNNAVGWAQFQLNGGWKNTLSVLVAYGVIVGGLIAVTASIDPGRAGAVHSMWTKGILGLQLAVLVIYGSHRIIGGIRRDLTGQMIESHRLMPVPPLHAVAGYIFGAASQAISLALINFILGAVTTRSARLPLDYWLKANLIIATFSVFMWMMVALAAMSARGALFWIVGPMVGFWMSGGTLSLLLPGISVIATPTQGASVFDAALGSREPAQYAVPMLCQAMIGSICVAAAMRKYRRSEAAAFSPLLALGLLAGVALTCTVGLGWFDDISPRYLGEIGDFDAQMIASMLVVMAFIAAAMCAIAWPEALARRAALRRATPPRRSFPPMLGVFLAAAIGAAQNYAAPWQGWADAKFLRFSTGVLLIHALSISHLARWMYFRVDRAAIVVVIWLATTWLGPLVVDLMLRTLSQSDADMGTISTWSPVGCLIAVAHPGDADPRIGLAGQFAIALIPVLLYYVEQLRAKRILKAD